MFPLSHDESPSLQIEMHRRRNEIIIIAHLIMMWLDIMIPDPLEHTPQSPGFPSKMDHNHPESSQLKLGPIMDQ